MESASDRNARLSQARRHQWKRVSTEISGERETRLQRLRAAQQLRLAAEPRVAPARQTMIYIRLVPMPTGIRFAQYVLPVRWSDECLRRGACVAAAR